MFLRRLWLPLLVLAGFLGVCVVFYMRVEGLRALDALFWVIHPHSIEYRAVHKSTDFSMFVYAGVFALQIWIAERILLTIFSRHGVEAWRTMVNEVNVDRLHDHFVVRGYGQVGRASSTSCRVFGANMTSRNCQKEATWNLSCLKMWTAWKSL